MAKMKRAPAKRRAKKAKAGTRGLNPLESRVESAPGDAKEVADRVEAEGGYVLGTYYDPLGKNPLVLAVLPIGAVEPTPFQRDLSQTHHRKLADVLDRTREQAVLDNVRPITVPPAPSSGTGSTSPAAPR